MLSKCFASIPIKHNMYAVYNTLLADPIFVSSDEYAEILSGEVSQKFNEILVKKGVFVSDVQEDIHRINYVRSKSQSRIGTNNFVILIMADFCNLSCDYCIEKQYNNVYKGNCMKKDVIDSFFDMVSSRLINLTPDVEFVLYGGEPLLNLEGIEYFLERRSNLLPQSKCSIVTNAVLLNKDIINLFKRKNVSIGISIDGPKEVTDAHIKYKAGRKSVFDDVQAVIPILCESGIDWGMSITITNELIKHKNDFFIWLNETKPKAVSFNLLKLAFEPSEKHAAVTYYKAAAEFVIEAHIKLLDMGITERDITRKIGYFAECQPVISDCAAASLNQLTINTNGDIHSCQCSMERMNCFGNVSDPESFKMPQECLTMYKNLPIYRDVCLHCCALPICGGGCLVQGKSLYCDNQYMDQGYCEYARSIMKWIYERLYSAIV